MSISRPLSPRAAVTAALERAVELGEIDRSELEWALDRLFGRVEQGSLQRRHDVLAAAGRVFAQRGYHHATLEEVAAELDLTKAGVYHYFGSKQEILDAICAEAMTEFERVLAESVAEPGNPADRLRLAAGRYLDLFLSDDSLTVFMRHFEDLSDDARSRLRKRRKRLELLLRRVLEEGAATGDLDPNDVTVAVEAVFGIVNWTYSWYARGGRLSPAEVRDALVRQVLIGIRPA